MLENVGLDEMISFLIFLVVMLLLVRGYRIWTGDVSPPWRRPGPYQQHLHHPQQQARPYGDRH